MDTADCLCQFVGDTLLHILDCPAMEITLVSYARDFNFHANSPVIERPFRSIALSVVAVAVDANAGTARFWLDPHSLQI